MGAAPRGFPARICAALAQHLTKRALAVDTTGACGLESLEHSSAFSDADSLRLFRVDLDRRRQCSSPLLPVGDRADDMELVPAAGDVIGVEADDVIKPDKNSWHNSF